MIKTILLICTVVAPLAAQFDLSGRTLKLGSATGGNQLNVGLDYANALANGTPCRTIWALAQSGGKGLLRLSDGSCGGGFDGNGAQIYATAADGQTRSISFTAGLPGGNQSYLGFDYAFSLKNGTAGLTTWAIGVDNNVTPHGLLRLSDGTGSGGFDANGAQVYATALDGQTRSVSFTAGLPGGNQSYLGFDYAFSVKNGTAGLTTWAIGVDNNVTPHGLLRLSDGSGAGGLDGNGAQIYMTAADGRIRLANAGAGPAMIFDNQNPGASQSTGFAFLKNGAAMYTFGTDGAGVGAREWYLFDNLYGKTRIQVDGSGNLKLQPTGGNTFSGQLQATQNSVTTTVGSSLAGTAFEIQSSSFTGNKLNAGVDFINALKNGTAGLTMWALGQSGNAGLFRVSNGTGSGGFDGNGAQVYCSGLTGVCNGVSFAAVEGGIQTNIGSSNASTGLNIQASSLTGHKLNAGVDFINSLNNGSAFATMWALGQSGNAGVLRLGNGTGSGGWDGNGSQIYAQASSGLLNAVSLKIGSYSGGNQVNVGLDFVNALKNGTGGLTMWALAQNGANQGVLRVSNGTGSGGLDGNGAYVYANGTQLQLSVLNMTGGNIFAPNGSGGLTGTLTVRNGAGSGSCSVTLSGGLVTGTTC